MSKATALAMLTGDPNAGAAAKPGLITPQVDPNPKTAAAAVAEPAPVSEQKPAEPTKDETLASRLAIIAKREAEFQKQKEDWKSEREKWEKTEKLQAEEYRKRGTEFDEVFKKDKLAALRMIGLSDTDLINILTEIEEKKEDPAEAARRIAQEEAQKIRDELAAEKKKIEDERNQFLITRLKEDITAKIKSSVDKYEYTAAEGAEGELQVYLFIEEDLKANQDDPNYKMLTVEEALEMAENYFEERDKAFDAIKKRKARLKLLEQPAETPTEPQTQTESPAGAQAARGGAAGTLPSSNASAGRAPTLTNDVAATTAAATKYARRETEEQKKARIIEKIRSGGFAR